MLFLVDGYNVTMNDPATRDLAKEAQRDALVRRLAARSKQMFGTGDVVVVFDARGQLGTSVETQAGVRVVYATDADTEIVRRCGAARGEVTVISDDRRMSARISQDVARRCVYLPASSAFESAGRGARRKGTGGIRRDEGLPDKANEITEELKGLWLEED